MSWRNEYYFDYYYSNLLFEITLNDLTHAEIALFAYTFLLISSAHLEICTATV